MNLWDDLDSYSITVIPASVIDKTEESRHRYNNGYYKEQLEIGLQFQDVVTHELYMRGIVVVGYASRRYQIERGENMLGAEIKRDGNFRITGNLYLEIAEKTHPDNHEYIPSGVMRGDNSWLFVIGDEKTIWIFSTKWLIKMISNGNSDRYKKVNGPTSIGYLMPLCEADKYCIRRIDM